MSIDFRTDQIRTSKIIASSSTGTNAKLLLYPSDSATDFQGGYNFSTSSIGTDIFLFISGTSNCLGSSTPGASVFGGDVYISGNLQVGGLSGFDVVLSNSTGFTINAGAPVYISASNQIANSRANASATAIVFGILVSSITNGNVGLVRYGGSVIIPSSSQTGTWTAGDTIYLDNATAGKLTNIVPSSSTTYILEVGQITTSPAGGSAILYMMKTSRILVP